MYFAKQSIKVVTKLTMTCQLDVDYVFAVLGSDHPSIIEAYAKRQKSGKTRPELLIFLHEVCVTFVLYLCSP